MVILRACSVMAVVVSVIGTICKWLTSYMTLLNIIDKKKTVILRTARILKKGLERASVVLRVKVTTLSKLELCQDNDSNNNFAAVQTFAKI